MKKVLFMRVAVILSIAITSCSSSNENGEADNVTVAGVNDIPAYEYAQTKTTLMPAFVPVCGSMPTLLPTPVVPLQEMVFLPPDGNGIVWLVPPTFEFETIFICFGVECDCTRSLLYSIPDVTEINELLYFFSNGSNDVSIMHHGFIPTYYFYDESEGVFAILRTYLTIGDLVLYTPEEFVTLRKTTGFWNERPISIEEADNTETLRAVRRIDLSQFEFNEYGVFHAYESYFDHLLDSEVAVVRGNDFMTDFIFGSQPWWSSRERNCLIPLMCDGKIGLMGINGEMVLPFMFEQFAFIDNKLAFARYNGVFGILSIHQSMR